MTVFILAICNVLLLFANQRGTSEPFISGDSFRYFCDHVYDETTPTFNVAQVMPYQTVFVKTDHDHLKFFFNVYHKKIKNPYILVTHNSDHHIPGPFMRYLNDSKLVAWFGQNLENYEHPKLIPIPIGIANKCWNHGNPETFLKMLGEKENYVRDTLLYMNISVGTYPNERTLVFNLFKNAPYCVVAPIKSHADYLADLLSSKFVISPRGNGIDCHRTWEALLMGAIPIVKKSSLDPMYEDLPVLIVNEWTEINEDFLNKKYAEMLLKDYNYDKIYVYYWLDLIRSYQK